MFLGSSMLNLIPGAAAQTIYQNASYKWKGNEIIQGDMRARAVSPSIIISNYEPAKNPPMKGMEMPGSINRKRWTLKQDISQLPHYKSDNVLENAVYNLSLEESLLAIEPDSTFRTGVFWGGVWTRDVSYSILHALAQLQPEVSKISLLAKVNSNNRIIQDTGTGGAWPCSTDRVTWILAAWEVYKVTGDMEWLRRIYPIVKNTVDDDRKVAYDATTGLMKGETSYLDWREQEYPAWAQPADIYSSETLGTTAVHYQSLRILAQMCRIMLQPDEAERYEQYAAEIKAAVNKWLWMPDKGYYGIYLYGRNHLILHPQMETLGEAFTILFDIADGDRARQITTHVEHEDFGTPCMFPNLKDQYPYHNDAMWPFVQGYWMKAVAKAGHERSLIHSISSIYRVAALFLTNQENMVIWNGDYLGLPINSPRQLWSVAANLSIVPNIYFGIHYEPDGIRFAPFVPKVMKGNRRLSNFKYREAVLDLRIKGYGRQLKSFRLDGVECKPYLPGNLKGNHTVEMVLDNVQPDQMEVNFQSNAYMPLTPHATIDQNRLTWNRVPTAKTYRVLQNGKELTTITDTCMTLTLGGEYAVVAIDESGYQSYMSEPLLFDTDSSSYRLVEFAIPFDPKRRKIAQSEGTGSGVHVKLPQAEHESDLKNIDMNSSESKSIMITRNENILITIPVRVKDAGIYAVDFRYANGNGPVNTDNKCATRLLKVNGKLAGAVVFPQRGVGAWNNWGWSSVLRTNLKAGDNVITLEFAPEVENMNIHVNQALLNEMRITKITER